VRLKNELGCKDGIIRELVAENLELKKARDITKGVRTLYL